MSVLAEEEQNFYPTIIITNILFKMDYNNFIINKISTKLLNSKFFKEFKDKPIELLDIGARWGVENVYRNFSSIISLTAIEPDKEETVKIEKKEIDQKWNNFKVFNVALYSKKKKINLNLLKNRNNSSIFNVNNKYYKRYSLFGFELISRVKVNADKIDNLSMSKRKLPEIMKIDTQGAELDILKGAIQSLKNSTVAITCEVTFFEIYKKIPLFEEIFSFLKSFNFTFIGFQNLNHRSTKNFYKLNSPVRERLMQADAIFLKDPIERKITNRKIKIIIFYLLINGYIDYVIEILKTKKLDGSNEIIKIIDKVYCNKNFISFLSKINKNKSQMIDILKKVDIFRDYSNINDLET